MNGAQAIILFIGLFGFAVWLSCVMAEKQDRGRKKRVDAYKAIIPEMTDEELKEEIKWHEELKRKSSIHTFVLSGAMEGFHALHVENAKRGNER